MERIEHQGRLIAIVHRGDQWKDGLDFLTADELYVQAGTWSYDAGRKLDAHRHLPCPRTAEHTQELAFVRSGRMRVDLYDDDGVPFTSRELAAGDLVLLVSGGHGYEVLEDGTRVLEVKNGPFPGVERDKVRF